MEIEQLRREDARWRILQIVNAGHPVGLTETLIGRVLRDVESPSSRDEVRRELAYLRDIELIEIGGEDDEVWFAIATAQGIAVVEYTAPPPAGIARPSRSM